MKPSVVGRIWDELESESRKIGQQAERLLRSLGDSAVGIRAGYVPQKKMIELLIEVPSSWSDDSVIPKWHGLGHEIVNLSLPPREKAVHLRLFLVNQEHRDIFLMVCEDLVSAIEGIFDPAMRVKEIENCLLRWRLFFEKSSAKGLTIEMQQGLFAELIWLNQLLKTGIDPKIAISSWKGCEQGFHDFDFNGYVTEVKSTKTKEPSSVLVNNERQLDNSGVISLHLYVVIMQLSEGAGATLPHLVNVLLTNLADSPVVLNLFQNKLLSAGYVDRQAHFYNQQFILNSEKLYQVVEGFPRIISIPSGTGDLRYRIFLGACESFLTNIIDYQQALKDLSYEK